MNICSPEEIGFSSDRLKRITGVMQRYVDEKKIAGIVSLVARHNRVTYLENFGWQDIAADKPMANNTIFRIYSMTKSVTSVALMMLFERGLVRLADPITRFIPEFKKLKVLNKEGQLIDLKREITVYDLLTHQAGLSYGEYEEGSFADSFGNQELYRADITSKEFIRRLTDLPLINQPGERWYYSAATDVVGFLVELIAGMTLAEYFEQEIFKPLGMIDTGFVVSAENSERLATLYEAGGQGALKVTSNRPDSDYSEQTRLHTGGHGLVSTAADYLRFAQLILNKGELDGVRLLGCKTVDLMTMNHLPPALLPMHYNGILDEPVHGIGYGLGFNVIFDVAQSGTMGPVGDYGWGGNAETYFWVSPKEQLIAILMAQCIPSLTYSIRNDFRTLVYQALVE